MASFSLLLLSLCTQGAVACCHHPCPDKEPLLGSNCTVSLDFDTCEYNEHCQTCDGADVCLNTTFATCNVGERGGVQGNWSIAVAGMVIGLGHNPNPLPNLTPHPIITRTRTRAAPVHGRHAVYHQGQEVHEGVRPRLRQGRCHLPQQVHGRGGVPGLDPGQVRLQA